MSVTELAQEMAAIIHQITDVDRARREVAKEYREKLTALHQQLESLAGDVETGQMRVGDDAEDDRPANPITDRVARAIEQLAPAPGSSLESVTIEAGGKSVTLTKEDGARLRRERLDHKERKTR